MGSVAVDHEREEATVAEMVEVRVEIGGYDDELRAVRVKVRVRVRVRVLREDGEGVGGNDEGVARVEREAGSGGDGGDEEEREEEEEGGGHRRRRHGRKGERKLLIVRLGKFVLGDNAVWKNCH